MKKYLSALLFFLLPSLAGAEWVLHQSDDGHWISGHNKQKHELVISQDRQQKKVLLVFSSQQRIYDIPDSARFSVDDNEPVQYRLKLIKQHSDGLAMQLVLDKTEQRQFINQLISGVNLRVQINRNISTLFSLMGFTTTLNDFLIANDIGRLDPMWLQIEDRTKELLCYEVSQAMVSAMKMRFRGKTESEVYSSLSGKMSDESATALPDVIEQVYSVPVSSLPRIPSTRKYEFFKRCMQSRN